MTDEPVTVKESRLDWLTLTFQEGGKWEKARVRAEHLIDREHEDGEDVTDLRFQGYTGIQAGRVGYGTRDNGALMRLSGALSDEHLDDLLPLASNVSRCDIAVTAKLPEGWPNPVTEGYANGPRTIPTRGAPPDYQIIRHSRKGDTLYVGARTSPRYGRIYNKWAESQLDWYRDCFRYELEAKGKLGARLAAALAGDPERRAKVRVLVHDYFASRGCAPPWDDDSPDLLIPSYRPRTTDLSRVLWLARQVKPVIDELRLRGKGADVAAALGVEIPDAVPWALPDDLQAWLEESRKPRVSPVPP